jgi:putative hydrolase of the HAD superfamily
MLLDIPQERLNLLRQLRPSHRLFLLSNTNQIHLNCFNKIVEEAAGTPGLEPFFDATYYSHQLKMRKPDREIYEHVLQEQQLQPHETLFLDDNLTNLAGAEAVGIRTFHVQHPDLIFSLFR